MERLFGLPRSSWHCRAAGGPGWMIRLPSSPALPLRERWQLQAPALQDALHYQLLLLPVSSGRNSPRHCPHPRRGISYRAGVCMGSTCMFAEQARAGASDPRHKQATGQGGPNTTGAGVAHSPDEGRMRMAEPCTMACRFFAWFCGRRVLVCGIRLGEIAASLLA